MKKLVWLSIVFLFLVSFVSASSFETTVGFKISSITGISEFDNSDGTSVSIVIKDSSGNVVVSRNAAVGVYSAGMTIPMAGEKFFLDYGTDYTYNLLTDFGGNFLYNFTTFPEPAAGIFEYQHCYNELNCDETNSCQQKDNGSWNPNWVNGREGLNCGFSEYTCRAGVCSTCPVGFVNVPGNVNFGTTSNFCVMQYEAKNVSGVATSQADVTPWVNISQINAIAECSAIGAHLCTVDEVQTINRDIELQTSNWANGIIGSTVADGGGLKRGNVGILDSASYNGSNPEFGNNRDAKASLVLSNGSVIWDWSGNVWEWIYGEGVNGTIGTTGGVSWLTNASWFEWNNVVLNEERPVLGPSNNNWNAGNGIGRYYGGAGTNAFIRGGDWHHGATAGVFVLYSSDAPSTSHPHFGFRCCSA